MGLIIPTTIQTVLKEADDSATPLDEDALCSNLLKGAPNPKVASLNEHRGTFAEIAAWRFMRSHGSQENEPWGIYWVPLASGMLADGKTPFYSPNVAEVDTEILDYWINRARNSKHPVIRSRYADLAWEIGRYLGKPAKDRPESSKRPISLNISFSLAQTAVIGYLDAVEHGLAQDEHHSWAFLDRAIRLALSLKDGKLTQRAKTVLFAYYRNVANGNDKFMWWRLSDLLDDYEKALDLDEEEKKLVMESLETALTCSSYMNDKKHFDPHQAMNAADRLIRRFGNKQEQIQRVTKRSAEAFEKIAEKASGLLAVSWLEDLLPRYRDAGLMDDAARVERAIRERAAQALGEMKRISIPVEIPNEELEKWVKSVVGPTPKETLGRIGFFCMMHEENSQKTVKDMVAHAPLVSRISARIMSTEGFTEAIVHPVEDDIEGRTIQHAADKFNWAAPLLHMLFLRAKEEHALDIEQLLAHIRESPVFPSTRETLLREGLAAWLIEDSVKAIHVLVPQLEAACRDLLSALGASVRKPNAKTGGSRVIGLGEILSHENFKKGVPKDIRFHLRALYSDPREINLRNHLAHGLAHEGVLGMGVANWIVHSILMLAILRIE